MKCQTSHFTGCENEAEKVFSPRIEQPHSTIYFSDVHVCKECAKKIIDKKIYKDLKMVKL